MGACGRTWNAFLLCCERVVDVGLRITGPIYVVLATSLISVVIYVFYTVILPLRYPLYSVKGVIHTVCPAIVIFNIFFNYFYCVFTNPGQPPPVLRPDNLVDAEIAERYTRWCKRCRKPKPVLAHHCHVCDRCVTRMDHHCPWMANCIGHFNYRYFFNFMFWLWFGCAYSVCMSVPSDFLYLPKRGSARTGIVFSFVISLAIFFALSCLWGWHVYLVTTGQTTIEFYNNKREKSRSKKRGEKWVNKFDLGAKYNWQEVFDERGKYWWLTWALPRRRPHSMAGVFWPTRFNLEEHLDRVQRQRVNTSKSDRAHKDAGAPNESSTAKEIV